MKKGLVLLNMGAARSKDELKVFLTNMFNDQNIISIKNDTLRSMVASLIVFLRLDKAWENYEEIGGESPLHRLSDQLVEALDQELDGIYVTTAMRYTSQFAQTAIAKLKGEGIDEVILLPLYPQYSTTTTKSSVEDFIQKADASMKITVVEPFYQNDLYNQVICDEIIHQIGDETDWHLIFSAHGLPQKVLDKGDPYQSHVEEHVHLLSEHLKGRVTSINLAYQSKVGPMKWLEPSLDTMLKNYQNKKVLIYPIAFIIDNSETVFELDIEYREMAEEIGVKEYKVAPCVNANPQFVLAIKEMIKGLI
jgi:ferrochelatase